MDARRPRKPGIHLSSLIANGFTVNKWDTTPYFKPRFFSSHNQSFLLHTSTEQTCKLPPPPHSETRVFALLLKSKIAVRRVLIVLLAFSVPPAARSTKSITVVKFYFEAFTFALLSFSIRLAITKDYTSLSKLSFDKFESLVNFKRKFLEKDASSRVQENGSRHLCQEAFRWQASH